jgi:4,5-DOPA dioxygenase extradiol
MTNPMPAIFFGHGNPMNALADNEYTRGWAVIGREIPRPSAIVCVSAHWYMPGTSVTSMAAPRTIHDFGGFPSELYQFKYPAPGEPELARRIRSRLAPTAVGLDTRWGLDHGTWSVLCHVFPEANVPVIQLSIDETQPARFHYELGKRLTALRDEGVLIIGSGNLIHNLHAYSWGRRVVEPFDWAVRFEERARESLMKRDHEPLIGYEAGGPDAQLSVPTPDHYLPLLYIIATQRETDEVSFPVEGFDGGSISMLTVRIG